jgi:uncharacterized RDD family membrane protein YckC
VSTLVVQPNSASSWKQEVNQRLAAHKSRRGWSTAKPCLPAQSWSDANSRAAQAAARVAARYAQAPSYSQMQAAEAHAALRAAGVATQAALKAHTAALAALAGLHASSAGPVAPHSLPATLEAWESECSHIRCEPDFTLRPIESAAARAPRPPEAAANDGWERPARTEEPLDSEAIEPVEPYTPIHANLIEFPRELVAARKMRPRRVEGRFADEDSERQLSIFEVDPGAISIHPEAVSAAPASAWPEPEWSGIELEAQPPSEPQHQEAQAPQTELHLAPIGYRLMAVLVDGALIAAVFLGLVLVAAAGIGHPPAAKIVELTAVSAFLLIALLYQTLFLTLAEATPGMNYAGISFCTFDGQIPTSAQLRSRLGALLLSVIPVGLGLAWVLFDDDHLSWHDRLSRTYPRKC